jgi:diadenosine tetraphosphate (Ap4A) HIT family hydrolase
MKKLKVKTPRQYSLVKFDFESMPIEHHKNYPFVDGQAYVFLGDIPNMPGHCVVINSKTNQVYSCYHTDNFIELTEDET